MRAGKTRTQTKNKTKKSDRKKQKVMPQSYSYSRRILPLAHLLWCGSLKFKHRREWNGSRTPPCWPRICQGAPRALELLNKAPAGVPRALGLWCFLFKGLLLPSLFLPAMPPSHHSLQEAASGMTKQWKQNLSLCSSLPQRLSVVCHWENILTVRKGSIKKKLLKSEFFLKTIFSCADWT